MMYYSGQEQGTWFGEASQLMGLTGTVTESAFTRILCGQSPSGKQLVRPVEVKNREKSEHRSNKQQRKALATNLDNKSELDEHVRPKKPKAQKQNVLGVDVTHSVPKDVSIFWACGDQSRRKSVEQCCLRAADRTNSWAEHTLKLARRGRNGQTRISAKLVGARFLHAISRAAEPQLHVHSLFGNMAYGEDGRWSKLDTRQLHTWTPAIGRIFRANLARELKKEFGLELSRPKDKNGHDKSWFVINGIPKKLVEANSSRRKAILETVGPHGLAKGKDAALARQYAAFATRDSKDPSINLDDVFDRVRKQADDLGFTKEKAERLVNASELPQERYEELAYESAIKASLSKLTDEVAHFRECDIVRHVVEELQHIGIDGSDLATRVISDIPNRPELVQLREHHGEKQFTTKEMWELESRFLEDVAALRSQPGATISTGAVSDVLSRHKKLFPEQRAAVSSLLSNEGGLRILTGVAGAGKSTAIAAVKEGYEKAGFRVIGGALAGATTQDLAQKTGIEARTVASYLYHFDTTAAERVTDSAKHHANMLTRELLGDPTWKKTEHRFDAKTVLILDEAGMLSTKELSRITGLVRKAGATLILAGDIQQLPAIGAGTPLQRLTKDLGHSHLSTNLRQQDPDDKVAVAQLREGNVQKALENYASRGRLVVEDSHFETVASLVEHWSAAGGRTQPERHIVLTQTRSDAKLVNELCQQQRLDAASLGVTPQLVNGDTRYFEGDRVLFHQTRRSHGIENGYFGRITKVDRMKSEVSVRLERQRTPTEQAKGLGQTVTIQLSSKNQELLSLGYAATSHKLQGATVDHAYVLLSGPLNSKEMAYVQATRARHSTHLFVDSLSAGLNLERLEKSLKRSKVKQLAHDLGREQSQL